MPEVTIGQAMQQAVRHHQAGRLAEAEAIYRRVLERTPLQADALHLLGVCLHQRGKAGEAIERIERAIAVQPSAPEFHYNLGQALRAAGDAPGAAACYQSALALKPAYADARRALEALQAGPVSAGLTSSEPAPPGVEPRWPAPGGKALSVLLLCAGDFFHSIRAVKGLTASAGSEKSCDVHVACLACSAATLAAVRSSYDAGRVATLFDCARDVGRAAALEMLAEVARTPYALVLDDDAPVADGWLAAAVAFVEQHHPFDLAASAADLQAAPIRATVAGGRGAFVVRPSHLSAPSGTPAPPGEEKRLPFTPALAAAFPAAPGNR